MLNKRQKTKIRYLNIGSKPIEVSPKVIYSPKIEHYKKSSEKDVHILNSLENNLDSHKESRVSC